MTGESAIDLTCQENFLSCITTINEEVNPLEIEVSTPTVTLPRIEIFKKPIQKVKPKIRKRKAEPDHELSTTWSIDYKSLKRDTKKLCTCTELHKSLRRKISNQNISFLNSNTLELMKARIFQTEAKRSDIMKVLSKKSRNTLTQWMWEVISVVCKDHVEYDEKAFWTAASLLDTYLIKVPSTPTTKYQLLGAACVWISVKQEGFNCIGAGWLSCCSDGAFNELDLLKMEMDVLETLNWDTQRYSPSDFADIILANSICTKCLALNNPLKCTESVYKKFTTMRRVIDSVTNDAELANRFSAFELAVAVLCWEYFDVEIIKDVDLTIHAAKLCAKLKLTNIEIYMIRMAISTLKNKNKSIYLNQ